MLSEESTGRNPKPVKVLYTDVDGTLTWRGGLMLNNSTSIFEALLRARAAGIDVVPVSGRGFGQVRELTRLLGLPRGIGELGCLHVDQGAPHWEFGDFPLKDRTPVDVMQQEGLMDVVGQVGEIEPHDPWNEGRHATLLLRGNVDIPEVEKALADAGFPWCQLVDNGLTRNGTVHVYHLMPRGAGKAYGVRRDLERHGIDRSQSVFVGDSRADLGCAEAVGQCWLVANADPSLDWPQRTKASYGDGVAELIDELISE